MIHHDQHGRSDALLSRKQLRLTWNSGTMSTNSRHHRKQAEHLHHYSGKLFLTPSNLSKIPRARFKNINKIKHVSVYLNGFIQNTHQKSQFRLTFFFLRSLHKYRKPTLSIDLFQRYSRKIMQE